VDRRVETEVTLPDRLLDGLERALVPRLDRDHARLGHVDVRHLRERRRGAVVIDLQAVQEARVRAPGAELRELALERFVGLRDGSGELALNVVQHGKYAHLTPTPSGSQPFKTVRREQGRVGL